jgi:two-component system, chemotaxis family, chemotaxis protein CheY
MARLDQVDRNMKILVVDSVSNMRHIVKNILQQFGFVNIEEAEDGIAALKKLSSDDRIGFVISAWNMPNMMGIDLLKTIRSNDKLKHLPFLMASARSQKESVLEAINAGVSDYIVKPFTADVLQTKIEAILCK